MESLRDAIIRFSSIGFDKNEWVVFGDSAMNLLGVGEMPGFLHIQLRHETFENLTKDKEYAVHIDQHGNKFTRVLFMHEALEEPQDKILVFDSTKPIDIGFDDILKQSFTFRLYSFTMKVFDINIANHNLTLSWKKAFNDKSFKHDVAELQALADIHAHFNEHKKKRRKALDQIDTSTTFYPCKKG